MILERYINDLLYRYECVIVPDFGGFVTNKIGARLQKDTHTFYAPSKQITFNSHLKHNDGLLANYIAASENISFEKAATAISLSVIQWQNQLQSSQVALENLGILSLNSAKKIIFEPNESTNFLTSSFGLSNVTSPVINNYKQVVKPLETSTSKKKVPAFIKYAATAAILLTLGVAAYSNYKVNEQKITIAKQEIALQKKIETATFVIPNPLPTLELNVVKKTAKPFHLVAGSFQFRKNAEKKVAQLKQKGFNAFIIGLNKWGLTQVAFTSYANKNDAINHLHKIKRTISKEAWLLVKE